MGRFGKFLGKGVKGAASNRPRHVDGEEFAGTRGRVEGGRNCRNLRLGHFGIGNESSEERVTIGVSLTEDDEHLVVSRGRLAFKHDDELGDDKASMVVDFRQRCRGLCIRRGVGGLGPFFNDDGGKYDLMGSC